MTPELVQLWIEAGKLTNLAKIAQKGAWGALRTTIPPISPTAWATFLTGVNPGKHGILDFTRSEPLNPISQPVSGASIEVPVLSEIINYFGKKVGLINLPMTYPPKPVNGFIISGFPMPTESANYTYPKELAGELQDKGWHLYKIPTQAYHSKVQSLFLEDLYLILKQRKEAAEWLKKQYEPDLFLVHILETDKVQHEFWQQMKDYQKDPSSVAEKFGLAIENMYQVVDQIVGEYLENLAANEYLIILSDHGFGQANYSVHLSNWLLEKGFLKLHHRWSVKMRYKFFKAGLTIENLYKIFPSRLQGLILKTIDQRYFSKASKNKINLKTILLKIFQTFILSPQDIDYASSLAYCAGSSGLSQIFINSELQKINPQCTYEKIKENLKEGLKQLQDPYSKQLIVEQIYEKDKIYKGNWAEQAADLIVEYKNANYITFGQSLFMSNKAIAPRLVNPGRGTHLNYGIFFIYGSGVKRGEKLTNLDILDVAPTILYLLGLPSGQDFDGKPIYAAFEEDLLEKLGKYQQVNFEDVLVKNRKENGNFKDLEKEREREQMRQSLKDMGYL